MSSPFLNQVRQEMRLRQYSIRTEHTYLYWIKFFIRFNRLQHPSMLGPTEVKAFLSYLACQRQVSANTQKVALNALQFLYGKFLKTPLGELNFTMSSRGRYLPAVLTPPEVQAILDAMHGSTPHKLIIQLLYGTGMRVSECLRLRIQDIDFGRNLIVIHDGKGKKDRTTLLPGALRAALGAQIAQATLVHQQDLALGLAPPCPWLYLVNTPTLGASPAGALCSLFRGTVAILMWVGFAVITCTRLRFARR